MCYETEDSLCTTERCLFMLPLITHAVDSASQSLSPGPPSILLPLEIDRLAEVQREVEEEQRQQQEQQQLEREELHEQQAQELMDFFNHPAEPVQPPPEVCVCVCVCMCVCVCVCVCV